METKKELTILFWIIAFFLGAFFMPLESSDFQTAVTASLDLLSWYAREHVVLCLLPAFFIAGVISIFVSQASVIKYFGANAKKWLAYTVASLSGTILAVCSCTILPLFSSIHKRGAGLGPAIAFLYSGPAINILAIILTARILGVEMGIARVVGAVVFSVVIGLIMAFIYRKEEKIKSAEQMKLPPVQETRPLWQTALLFFSLVLILVFANWGKPSSNDTESLWYYIWAYKWYITAGWAFFLAWALSEVININRIYVIISIIAVAAGAILFENPMVPVVIGVAAVSMMTLFTGGDGKEWTLSSWEFAKQIMPLLALGVIISGFLLGSTHDGTKITGVIPDEWISTMVGGNSIFSNFFASITGAFMYFATLTEVPILQGLMGAGMGKGPALALLLAGPALSLPSMLVIKGVIGWEKTIVYVSLVVVMATITGFIYGSLF